MDLSVTAASVLAGPNARKRTGVAGATITAGQTVYEDTADSSKFKLADNNASTMTAKCVGIALHGASNGQPLTVVYEDDDFQPGATLVTGTIYVLSSTAGGIAPASDLTSGNFPVVLFVAKSASKAVMKLVRGGTAI